METIEDKARWYQREGDGDGTSATAFEDGAEWIRKELTKWSDPNKPPERSKDVLLKLRYEADAEPSYTVGYWNGVYYGDVLGADAEIIGWREIHK